MGMKTKVYNEGGTNQTNKALSTVCFSFFITARLGPSASQVGAASSLQDLAQALLKVLAPTPAASADPEVPAASPAASPEASPAAGTTAVSEPAVAAATAPAPPATAPAATAPVEEPPATPLPPTQLEGESPAPVDTAEAVSPTDAEIAEAETQPGEIPELTLTKGDLKGLSEGVLDCDFFLDSFFLEMPLLTSEIKSWRSTMLAWCLPF